MKGDKRSKKKRRRSKIRRLRGTGEEEERGIERKGEEWENEIEGGKEEG